MDHLALTITIAIAVLTVFLSFITVVKYAVPNNFKRTRLIMSSFLVFIVITLTMAFWRYTADSLPITIPTWMLGMIIGYFVAVRTERKKLNTVGLEHYMEHFAHVYFHDIKSLNWWSIINFYSVMGGLTLINLVGLSTVIFEGRKSLAIFTAAVGAFLIGTLVPYIAHLWSIKTSDIKV